MCRVIGESRPKARLAHQCMAYEYLENSDLSDIIYEMTYAEKRAVVRAKLNGGLILPGQVYVRIFMDLDGYLETYKAIPEIHDICQKYSLFEDC